ncbi:MAG: hypothetical protein K9G58_02185 [Bacteroidales bacterium]|nr:hypothetical protein [Bacteroidales bacterium]MCF8396945.1 hypothetical protein [Bacteroidales bacterium]
MTKLQIQMTKSSGSEQFVRSLINLKMILVILLFSFSHASYSQDIHSIRSSYFLLNEKECEWMDFVESTEGNNTAVAMAYRGSALAASAQCAKGPFNKLRQFNKGRKNLEKAVTLEPDNVEIRFLRYQVKLESPGILNYKDIGEDESMVMQAAMDLESKMDTFLLNKIRNYLLKKGDLSYAEKMKIKGLNQDSNRDG